MNVNGEYTDGPGRVLTVGAQVIMANQNQAVPAGSQGVVESLPAEGNDFHSFPRVDFGALGKHHVPDVSLRVDDRPTSTPIDWDNLAEWVAGLESSLRTQLTDALRDHESAERVPAIIEKVRGELDLLSHDDPEFTGRPIAVVFTTMEFDNGRFLTESGSVRFADGSTDEIEFSGLDEIFTDEYGCVGSDFTLGVDLRTDEVHTDDHYGNVLKRLGLKN